MSRHELLIAHRGDIEGLRAVAVLPILLFHLDAAWCPGGFAGVDIFFVISGYLITRMILAEGEAFSFKRFYVRRFFRLFPALIATLVASLAAGWLVLGPHEYDDLARSAVAAALAVSNFHFLAAVDYFNASSLVHPLLHTWSLGVEEQFYVVWPALLVLAMRRSLPPVLLAAGVAALSLAAIALMQPTHPQLVFYMMPFRMFEFGIGACVIALEQRLVRPPAWMWTFCGAVGAALLVLSLLAFDGDTRWPGPWTLIPAAGTALMILAGRGGPWKAVLSTGALRFIGRISYSLYLVHWPVVTLYRHYTVTEPSLLELVLLGAACLALAATLYATVELPFRIGGRSRLKALVWSLTGVQPRRVAAVGVALMSSAFAGGAAAVIASDGFPSRLDRTRVQFIDKGLTFAGDICSSSDSRCMFGDQDASNIVYVVGDSHALNLLYGLDRLFRDVGIKGIALYDHGCPFLYGTVRFLGGVADEACRRHVAHAYSHLAGSRNPVILAADYAGYQGSIAAADASAPLHQEEAEYYGWLGERLEESLSKLNADRRPVLLIKQAHNVGLNLATCLARPGAGPEDCAPWTRAQVRACYQQSDAMIDAVARAFPSVITIDPKELFCDSETCTTGSSADLYFRDNTHLTNSGSDFLIGRARDAVLRGLGTKVGSRE